MKKIIYLSLLLCILSFSSSAQRGWAYLKGEVSAANIVSGVKGQPHHNNTPGLRYNTNTWYYNGKLYLYGGVEQYSIGGATADMWCFDTTTQDWVWLSGDLQKNVSPVYGTKGVPSSSNTPGSRESSATWVLNGKMYLYGGNGFDDLWSYNIITQEWTWLSGNVGNKYAVFGTQGVAVSSNKPGGVSGPVSWVYNDKLYMYGGTGYDSLANGYLNDIWEYNPSTSLWTWIKGGKYAGHQGNWGTKKVPSSSNLPRAVPYNVNWFLSGKLYIYSSYGDYIWSYDHATNVWVWLKGTNWTVPAVYGIKGAADSLNSPGSLREGSSVWVHNNKMYLYGGQLRKQNDPNDYYKEDLWELDPSTLNWTWVGGSKFENTKANFLALNISNSNVWPGPHDRSSVWVAGNVIYLMGSSSPIYCSDAMWKYDLNTLNWTWVKGMHNPLSRNYYVEKHVENNLNEPSGDISALWKTNDSVFVTNYEKVNNENIALLWLYRISKNTWQIIDDYDMSPKYGVAGIPNLKNCPGYRYYTNTWAANGSLYLYGGQHYSRSSTRVDDMWSYNLKTHVWTWLKGDTTGVVMTSYGTKGVASTSNSPGFREGAHQWTIGTKFYLFGGRGYDVNGQFGHLNDLWEYDLNTNNWTWIKGSQTVGQYATYGTKGIASSSNNPGSRRGSSTCVSNGKLYMFGGECLLTSNISINLKLCNELWEFDPATNNWRYVSGELSTSPNTVFGTKGVAAITNTPGRKSAPNMWSLNGKIYVYGGGGGHVPYGNSYFMDDMWEFDTANDMWTWIDGSTHYDNNGYYEYPLTISLTYSPGAGLNSFSWAYDNNLYLYSGDRFESNINKYGLRNTNAIWLYRVCESPSACFTGNPIIDIDSVIAICNNQHKSISAGNFGCKYLWSTGDTTQVINLIDTGKYWVTVTSPNSFVGSDTFYVIQRAVPNVNLGADTSFCKPDSLIVGSYFSGASYYWSTGDTSSQIFIKDTIDNYTLLIVDSLGCYSSDEINVSVYPNPPKPILSSNAPLCIGESLEVLDSVSTQGKISMYGPNGYLTNSRAYFKPTVSLADSGLYYVVDSLNGCVSSDSLIVIVDTIYIPSVKISVTPSGPVWPYLQLTFIANVNYGAGNSTFQWYKNGVQLVGETQSVYQAIVQTDIQEGDVICVKVHNSNPCLLVDSANDCGQPFTIQLSVNPVLNNDDVFIFPNPVNNYVYFNGLTHDASVRIVDVSGRQMFKGQLSVLNSKIDVSKYHSGVYLIHIIQEGKTSTKKMLKE